MRLPLRVQWAQSWIGLRALASSLGWWRALAVGLAAEARVRRGEPFSGLSAPATEQERLSRQQAAPLITLYQELSARGISNPVDVTRQVVVESAVPWMRYAVGALDRDVYQAQDSAGRMEMLQGRIQRFFNMTVTDVRAEEESAGFRVVSCHFPGLCERAGVPEVAPLFCAVDAHYFGGVEPSLRLERPHTMAQGGADCPFHFRFLSGAQERSGTPQGASE